VGGAIGVVGEVGSWRRGLCARFSSCSLSSSTKRIMRRAEASDQEKAARSLPGGRTGLKIDPRLKQLTSAPVCGC
jgi:hypothetical protein